jgi:hypothetical protein
LVILKGQVNKGVHMNVNKRLAVALKNRNEDLARKLCKQGADPNCDIGISKGQFLSDAVRTTDIDLVKLLLDLGAKPRKIDDVFSIFYRLTQSLLIQCQPYLKQRSEFYYQFKKGELTSKQLGLLHKKLEKEYKKDEFGIVKLKIANELVKYGAVVNERDDTIKYAIQHGINEYRLILFFLLQYKFNIESDFDNHVYPIDLHNSVKVWASIANHFSKSEKISKGIKNHDINPILEIPRRDIVKRFKEKIGALHTLIKERDNYLSGTLKRKEYMGELKKVDNIIALVFEEKKDGSICLLIEPKIFNGRTGKFWIEKKDRIYLNVNTENISMILEFEIIDIESNHCIIPYTNKYVCIIRKTLE